jgi:hypothetical protein
VAVKEVDVPPVAAAVNATVADPLLNALDVPTFVAAPIVGASGTSGIATPLLVMPDVLARLILAMLPIVSYGCWKKSITLGHLPHTFKPVLLTLSKWLLI